ncbi:ubiquitin carboxyl-terminal hydrolase 16 [Thalassophryne amazonica]|uniref:ubiquitin carboxyl-terminal hydrolase 16 n=1 Tax=Thalassophryne amazonica TaxID=390379 RepID=UPI00147263FF|nr:ubiquitin carboxyl-terminal hydrolase 16 [Thalassophryne amazonica]XP_034024320.1 ubiquitin carboxyl-terminal hydrolase 16 [Thalassophryne amazonica]XP_034024321.1 ubiquitin carboxyl-terminal hydrolase 16 [Thalassophryne amazonica]
MGKKRGKDKSSREEDDTDFTGPSCRHIKKGIDQNFLKKSWNFDWTTCQDCKQTKCKDGSSSNLPQDSEDEKETVSLWMCLKCGHRGCGRSSENQHAVKHYDTPRSDPHCLVVSLDTWSVWCYICDTEVLYSGTGLVAQLVANIKKHASSETTNRSEKRLKEEDVMLTEEPVNVKTEESEDKENQNQQMKNRKKESVNLQKCGTFQDNNGVSVKGLNNLGNTCFFNAVIQSLSQTQLLRQTLSKVTEEKTSLNVTSGASSHLEPLSVHLDQPGSMTSAMYQLLNELQESKKAVVTPRELFAQVCKKAARFKGFQQQDSQELLRYLLDGMRSEETKRVSSGIMEALKQSRGNTDGEELKTVVKEYEKSMFPKTFVDEVFGGEMTSTIICQQCKTVSVITEMFLDLSLPVADEVYRKKTQRKGVQKTSELSQEDMNGSVMTNGSDDIPIGGGSKYQQKKAKKQAKKQAKHQRRQQKFEGRMTLDSLTSPSCESTQTDSSDANDQENADSRTDEETPLSERNPEQMISEQDQKNIDTVQDKNEDEDHEDSVMDCDSSGTSVVGNRFNVLSEGQDSKSSIVDDDKMSDVDQDLEDDSLLVSEMEKVSLNNAFIEDSDAGEESPECKDEPLEAREYTVVNQDPEQAFQTWASRRDPDKQECSVHSCLFHFTQVDPLTQNNSLLCVTCTKQQPNNNKAGGTKKNVYTDALKQMLVSSPPPILTLHLKRFQQNDYSICKVNRHVHFPFILDLAPFCAVNCKNVMEGESQVLYSLYGVVEHSGTMRSGHYTAYVKVQPQCSTPSSNGYAAKGDLESPRGSWFHISDTSVQPVTESKVQSSQAYLLFYERIL